MRSAGRRTDRIQFALAATAENDFGEDVEGADAAIGAAYAEVNYGTGAERRAAGHEGASVQATFRVPATAMTRGVTTEHVILFDGGRWDVTSNVPWQRRERDITATRRA